MYYKQCTELERKAARKKRIGIPHLGFEDTPQYRRRGSADGTGKKAAIKTINEAANYYAVPGREAPHRALPQPVWGLGSSPMAV